MIFLALSLFHTNFSCLSKHHMLKVLIFTQQINELLYCNLFLMLELEYHQKLIVITYRMLNLKYEHMRLMIMPNKNSL